MRIAVIGTGYVGLVSGIGLANCGHQVVCFDTNKTIISSLNSGVPTIHEAGLEKELKQLLEKGKITFSLNDPETLADVDVILIAVGTPSSQGDINLEYVISAAQLAGEAIKLQRRKLSVIVKSTVVPGTTTNIVRKEIDSILEGEAIEYGLGMNPEFLREGSAIVDFQNPDRIVLGYENEIARLHLQDMYENFSCPKVEVNTKTAELIKYTNNFLLALLISSTNEIANLAARIGDIDPQLVMDSVLLDRRWCGDWEKGDKGHDIHSYLRPGPGFGGSCFPKDVEALVALGTGLQVEQTIAKATLAVNAAQPECSMSSILDEDLSQKKILVLGLAFKPETDDVRETPSKGIIDSLHKRGATIFAHDPLATPNFQSTFGASLTGIEYVKDWETCASLVDIVVLVTPWQEYRERLSKVDTSVMTLVDPRRAISPQTLPHNWNYKTLGEIS